MTLHYMDVTGVLAALPSFENHNHLSLDDLRSDTNHRRQRAGPAAAAYQMDSSPRTWGHASVHVTELAQKLVLTSLPYRPLPHQLQARAHRRDAHNTPILHVSTDAPGSKQELLCTCNSVASTATMGLQVLSRIGDDATAYIDDLPACMLPPFPAIAAATSLAAASPHAYLTGTLKHKCEPAASTMPASPSTPIPMRSGFHGRVLTAPSPLLSDHSRTIAAISTELTPQSNAQSSLAGGLCFSPLLASTQLPSTSTVLACYSHGSNRSVPEECRSPASSFAVQEGLSSGTGCMAPCDRLVYDSFGSQTVPQEQTHGDGQRSGRARPGAVEQQQRSNSVAIQEAAKSSSNTEPHTTMNTTLPVRFSRSGSQAMLNSFFTEHQQYAAIERGSSKPSLLCDCPAATPAHTADAHPPDMLALDAAGGRSTQYNPSALHNPQNPLPLLPFIDEKNWTTDQSVSKGIAHYSSTHGSTSHNTDGLANLSQPLPDPLMSAFSSAIPGTYLNTSYSANIGDSVLNTSHRHSHTLAAGASKGNMDCSGTSSEAIGSEDMEERPSMSSSDAIGSEDMEEQPSVLAQVQVVGNDRWHSGEVDGQSKVPSQQDHVDEQDASPSDNANGPSSNEVVQSKVRKVIPFYSLA
jgi:hypothetical protein